MPYGASLSSLWSAPAGDSTAVDDVLARDAISQDASLDSFERLRGLGVQYSVAESLWAKKSPNIFGFRP